MKVCIFGNSHIGALKQALDQGALRDQDIDVVFFGAQGKHFGKIEFRNGVLTGPREVRKILHRVSGGLHTKLDPREFDAIVIHSGSLYLHQLVGSIYRRIRDGNIVYTSGFIRAGVEQWLLTRPSFQLGMSIREETGTRVILSPKPCPADDRQERGALASKPKKSRWHWNEMPAEFRRSIWNLCAETARQYGMEFVLQPEETLTPNQYTQMRYTKGSIRLLSGRHHGEIDTSHMNAEYGALVLEKLAATLKNDISPVISVDTTSYQASTPPARSKRVRRYLGRLKRRLLGA